MLGVAGARIGRRFRPCLHAVIAHAAQTRQMPPIKTMLELGLPVGLCTDGT